MWAFSCSWTRHMRLKYSYNHACMNRYSCGNFQISSVREWNNFNQNDKLKIEQSIHICSIFLAQYLWLWIYKWISGKNERFSSERAEDVRTLDKLTETEMSKCWWNFCPWSRRKLSKWQLLVLPLACWMPTYRYKGGCVLFQTIMSGVRFV